MGVYFIYKYDFYMLGVWVVVEKKFYKEICLQILRFEIFLVSVIFFFKTNPEMKKKIKLNVENIFQ
jgi:hypothetical protein